MLDNNEDKNKIYKYIGLFFAVMVGAFLAVYFAITMAFNTLFNPFVTMHHLDKEMNKMEKEMIPADSILPQHMRNYFEQETGNLNIVHYIKSPEEYKFIINLKPFDNNPNNIDISIQKNTISFSGKATVEKKHSQSFTSFSQSYTLDDDVNFEKMSKKQVNKNKYIVTVPIED